MIGRTGAWARRGALSARQAARVDPSVLVDGQRICTACARGSRVSQMTGPGDLVELSTPALPLGEGASCGIARNLGTEVAHSVKTILGIDVNNLGTDVCL